MADKVPPVPLGRAGRILEAIGGAMILAMMVVTAIDVAGRYFLNRPIGGAFEVTEILMGLVIFAGMPLATARREPRSRSASGVGRRRSAICSAPSYPAFSHGASGPAGSRCLPSARRPCNSVCLVVSSLSR